MDSAGRPARFGGRVSRFAMRILSPPWVPLIKAGPGAAGRAIISQSLKAALNSPAITVLALEAAM